MIDLPIWLSYEPFKRYLVWVQINIALYTLKLPVRILMSNSQLDKVEIVTTKRVSCDGGGGAMGHPRVYMDMAGDSSVVCKYCGRVFKLDPNASASDHH